MSGVKPRPAVRPNGNTYAPRKVVGECWDNSHAGWGDERGVAILGNNSPEATKRIADELCTYWHGATAMNPQPGWWRLGWSSGELRWIDDPVRGRAGVMWEATDE